MINSVHLSGSTPLRQAMPDDAFKSSLSSATTAISAPALLAQASRVEGMAQSQTVSTPIKQAITAVLFGGEAPKGLDPSAFQYDTAPRSQAPIGNRWGIVMPDSSSGKLGAYVAPEQDIANQLGASYGDARHGMTPRQVVDGVIANEVAGKVASIAFPKMSSAQLEVVSEAASYKVAGDNWGFRHLIGVQGEQGDFEAGRRGSNYAMLLSLVHRSMGEAGAAAGVVTKGDTTEGAQLAGRFFSFMNRPGIFQEHSSFPDAFRGFAQKELGLSEAAAGEFASDFASRMSSNTRQVAERLISAFGR